MADVVPIAGHAAFEHAEVRSAARTLRMAHQRRPVEVLVIGVDQDGELFVGGHPNEPGNAFWLMEMAKKRLTKNFE